MLHNTSVLNLVALPKNMGLIGDLTWKFGLGVAGWFFWLGLFLALQLRLQSHGAVSQGCSRDNRSSSLADWAPSRGSDSGFPMVSSYVQVTFRSLLLCATVLLAKASHPVKTSFRGGEFCHWSGKIFRYFL